MKIIYYILALYSLCACTTNNLEVNSPNGVNTFHLTLNKEGELSYIIISNTDTIVKPSSIGLESEDSTYTFDKKLTFVSKQTRKIDETYTLPSGKQNIYHNLANETTFSFKNETNRTLHIICRAYNDGIAFKYKIDNDTTFVIKEEKTTCRLNSDTKTWIMDWRTDYENYYPERNIDSIANNTILSFPALTQYKNNWMLITESAVYDTPAMHLFKPSQLPILHYNYASEDTTFIANTSFNTSWKTFIIGNSLKTIVESILVENLNPHSIITDQEWITPGVATFPWWGNYLANSYIDTLKKYIDLAAEMKWEWLEFDVSLINSPLRSSRDWENTEWIPILTQYAQNKGIKIYGWDEINVLANKSRRDFIFNKYKELGIDGIKVDYINSDSQLTMQLRDTIAAEAAQKKLMVSFHGETLPRGQRRRYPNIMTNEAVKGAEYYTFAGHTCPNSKHNCTLPFTRNVIGPMDYTPVTFTIRQENPRTTSYAHELALAFVFESGWICMADYPEAYLSSPARPLLEKIEAAWDEIQFIDGYPGKFFCVARRKGNKWFIAGINSDKKRTICIPLTFLPEGKHNITIYNDDPKDPLHKLTIKNILNQSNQDVLQIEIIPHGGFVVDVEN